MTTINPKLFKKYDIRGKAEGDDALLTTGCGIDVGTSIRHLFPQS